MDSWLIDKIWHPDVKLYINIGNEYSKYEIVKLDSDVHIYDMKFLSQLEREDKIIPLRNLYFLSFATNFGEEICLGATNGDRVLDKSLQFGKQTEDLFNYLYQKQHWTEEKRFKINLEFKSLTKTELLKKYLDQGGNIEEAFFGSFSCYNPRNKEECWKCKPCFRKWVSFKLNGYQTSKKIIDIVVPYILEDIYPSILNNTYGRKKEEQEILKAIKEYI